MRVAVVEVGLSHKVIGETIACPGPTGPSRTGTRSARSGIRAQHSLSSVDGSAGPLACLPRRVYTSCRAPRPSSRSREARLLL